MIHWWKADDRLDRIARSLTQSTRLALAVLLCLLTAGVAALIWISVVLLAHVLMNNPRSSDAINFIVSGLLIWRCWE